MVAFPLLLIPLAVYNIIVVMMPGLQMSQPVVNLPLNSGAVWSASSADILVALAVFLLMLELVKAARPGGKTLVEILLSILLCGGAIAQFVLYPSFATSVFFLLVVISVVDVLGSIAISAQSRRRIARHTHPASETRREPTIPDPEPDNMQHEAIRQDNLHQDNANQDNASQDKAPADRTAEPKRSPFSPDGVTAP